MPRSLFNSCIPSIAPHSEHGQVCGACSGACASPLSHLSLQACTAGNSNFEFAEARSAVEVTNTTPLFRTYLPAHSETPHMPHTHMAVDWVIQLAVTIVYPDHCPRMCANSRKQFCMQHARDGRKSHTNDSKSPPHMHQSRNYHEGVLRCQ